MSADAPPLPAPPAPGLFPGLRKYAKIFRVSLTERLVYRLDFLLATLLRFLPVITTILLWQAIYAGSEHEEFAGFRLRDMIAYLLLVHISRMFSSMPGLAHGIARDIRDGNLKKYLLQPLDMIVYLVSYRLAHKAAYIATTALPYALLFFLYRDNFDGLPPWPTLAAYALSLVLSFFVGFFFEASIGMFGFWMLEVTSLLYILNTINFFLSGHLFPIDLLPEPYSYFLRWLPFQYLAYFPAAVFLGKVSGPDLAWGLAAQAGWAVVLVMLSRLLYRAGLRRYSAFGG